MQNALIEKPVQQALLAMAAPAAVGMLMTFLFQLVDTYFVGQLGTAELAAISFAYPVYFLVISFFMGAAGGVSAVVGKALGERLPEKAQKVTGISTLLFMLLTLLLGVLGFYSVPHVFTVLGANSLQIQLISQYMQPLYLGMFMLVGTLITNAALMAKGVMVKTTVIMGISGVVNLVLDYVLIFGLGSIPAMELAGAAIATVIAWAVGLLLMLNLAYRHKIISLWPKTTFNNICSYLMEVKTIATPAIVAQILNPIAIAVVTSIVAKYGENAVAAYGIVTRIESLGLTGILALSVIMTPLVAQNFGEKKAQRLDQVIAYSGRMTVYWGLLFYVLILVMGKPLVEMFSQHPEIISISQNYFIIVGISLPFFGLLLCNTSFFNGVQEAKSSLKLTLVKSLVLTIPLASLASFVNLTAVWLAIAAANVIASMYAGKVLNQWLRKNDSPLVNHSIWQDYVNDFKYIFKLIKSKKAK